jgi:hypothetical protein
LTILRFSGGLYAILRRLSLGLLLEIVVDVKGGSVKQPLLLLGNQCLKERDWVTRWILLFWTCVDRSRLK